MPIIKVRDYSGAERAYDTSQCKDTLLLSLADGSGNVPFSYGVTASETVDLDFSGGICLWDIARRLRKKSDEVTPRKGSFTNQGPILFPDMGHCQSTLTAIPVRSK